MKNNQRSYFIFVWVITFVLFILITLGVISQSLGYRYNNKTHKIELTGMMVVKTVPKDAYVYIDGKQLDQTTPARMTKLLPGQYNIKIAKEGYSNWEKTVNIESGKATIIANIYLFNHDLINMSINSDDENIFNKQPDNNARIINNSEIYIKKGQDLIFITRFSQDVKSALSINNDNNILYQVENKVFACDLNGQNIITIITLKNSDIVQFRIIGDDIALIKQSDSIVKIKVR